jgi:Tfp pilus assembly protein PilF
MGESPRPAPAGAASGSKARDAAASDAARKANARAHYVQAATYLKDGSVESVYSAIDEYSAAARLDSSSARTYAGLALAYARVLQHGWYESNQGAALAESRGLVAADLAVQLDQQSEEAWLARGTLLEFSDPRSLAEAFRSYRRALALAPNDAEALRLYGRTLESTGNYDAANAIFRRALTFSPNNASVLSDMADLAYVERQFAEAKVLVASATASDPRNSDVYLLRVRMRLRDAQFRDAWTDAEMAGRLGHPLPGAAASILVWAQMPDTASARRRADSLVREVRRRESVMPVLDGRYLALTLAAIGEIDVALEVLESVYPRGASLWLALQDPGFERLRGLRRYQRLSSQAHADLGSRS